MPQRIFLLTLCLYVLLAGGVQAKQVGEYIDKLLVEHDRILAAEQARDAARHGVRQAEAGWYPKLDLSGDVSREEIDRAGMDAATNKIKNTQTLRASQLIYDFGAASSGVSQAEFALLSAEEQLEFTRQSLMFEGAQAYLNTLRAVERLKYARRSEGNIKQQTGIEEALVERGAGLSSDVLQAKQQLAGAMALRVLYEGERATAANRFKAVFTTLPTPEDMRAFTRPPAPFTALPVSRKDAIRTAIKKNPQLNIARHAIDLAGEQVDIAEAAYFPTFNAFGQTVRKENDAGQSGVRGELAYGVEFRWNLFNGGADVAAVRAAEAGVRQAEFSIRDLNRTIEEQVRTAWDNLITFRTNAEFLNNQANILGEFLDLARKERKMGTRSLLDVLNAEVTSINAISAAVSAEIDTMVAAYNLIFAMGEMRRELFEE